MTISGLKTALDRGDKAPKRDTCCVRKKKKPRPSREDVALLAAEEGASGSSALE